MIGKLHINGFNKLFACCDKELLNTKITFNDLEINISDKFYGTTNVSDKEVIKNIEECTQANIFGKKTCDLLLSKNIISKEQIVFIDDIPHVQIYKI
jgi:uncharacterized protein